MIRKQKTFARQQGIALIMVLLLVAIASILTASMAARQHIDIRRTVNILDHEQIYTYLLATEDLAKFALAEDLRNNQDRDTYTEVWHKETDRAYVEGGSFNGRVYDLQARLNLNNLVQGNAGTANPFDAVFRRFLTQQFSNIPALQTRNLSPDITDAIIDWIDADPDAMSAAGAEDSFYLSRPIPHRTANAYITSTSELLLINGFDYAIYKELKDFLTALPVATRINVNTAPDEVLMALSPQMTSTIVDRINAAKSPQSPGQASGWGSVQDFLSQPALSGITIDQTLIDVRSEYFLVVSDAVINDSISKMYSIMHRNPNGEISVILRSQREI